MLVRGWDPDGGGVTVLSAGIHPEFIRSHPEIGDEEGNIRQQCQLGGGGSPQIRHLVNCGRKQFAG